MSKVRWKEVCELSAERETGIASPSSCHRNPALPPDILNPINEALATFLFEVSPVPLIFSGFQPSNQEEISELMFVGQPYLLSTLLDIK